MRAFIFDGPEGGPVVVHFHGNGETFGDNVWVADLPRRRRFGVVLAVDGAEVLERVARLARR